MLDLTRKWYQGIANVITGTSITAEENEAEKIAQIEALEKTGDYYAQPKCDGIYATISGVNGSPCPGFSLQLRE